MIADKMNAEMASVAAVDKLLDKSSSPKSPTEKPKGAERC